jgi:hypothetical protein
MRFTDESGDWYDTWYKSRRKEIVTADKRLAGYMGRKPIHVLKAAMMLSVSQRDDLILTVDDLQRAVRMIESLEPGLRRLFCAIGRNVFAPITHRILEQLSSAPHGITVSDLLMLNIGDVDYDDLKRNLSTAYMLGMALPMQTGVQKALDVVVTITPKGREYIKGNWSAEDEALEDTMLFAKEPLRGTASLSE